MSPPPQPGGIALQPDPRTIPRVRALGVFTDPDLDLDRWLGWPHMTVLGARCGLSEWLCGLRTSLPDSSCRLLRAALAASTETLVLTLGCTAAQADLLQEAIRAVLAPQPSLPATTGECSVTAGSPGPGSAA